MSNLLFLTYADLVADGAGSFARALTGSLTFTAAAFFKRGLQIRFVDSLDVFHDESLLEILSCAVDDELGNLFERKRDGNFQRRRQIDTRRLDVCFRPRSAVVNRVRGTNNFYRRVDVRASDVFVRDDFFQRG